MSAVEGHEKTTSTKKTATPTRYVILQSQESKWMKLGFIITAQGADAALKAVAAKQQAPNGTQFVAIPERSWRPKAITVETQPRVRLT